jgi:biopolymer transport protein ExbB
MIQAFHKMASAGGQIEVGAPPKVFIRQMTTVVGLVVELLLMGYNHLVVKNKIVHQMEANA